MTPAEHIGEIMLRHGWPKDKAEAAIRQAAVVAAQQESSLDCRLKALERLANEIRLICHAGWDPERLAKVKDRVNRMKELCE